LAKYHVYVTADEKWRERLLVFSEGNVKEQGGIPALEVRLAESSLWFARLGTTSMALDALIQSWEEKGRPRQLGNLHPCAACGEPELAVFNALVRRLEEHAGQLEHQDGRAVYRLKRFELTPLQLQEMVSAVRLWGKAEVKVEAVYSRVEMGEGGCMREEIGLTVPTEFGRQSV